MKKAHPLMDIYREERKKELHASLLENAGKEGRRRRVSGGSGSGSPAAKKLLEEILERNHVVLNEKTVILESYEKDPQHAWRQF